MNTIKNVLQNICHYDGCKQLHKKKLGVKYCKTHLSIESILQDKVLEKHIVSVILKMKNEMEYADIINKYDGKWGYISKHHKLSEEFIIEFRHHVDWELISGYQKISEKFIRDHQDEIDWSMISCHQPLSLDFIQEFQDRLNFYWINRNSNIPNAYKKKFGHQYSLYEFK